MSLSLDDPDFQQWMYDEEQRRLEPWEYIEEEES